MSFNRNLLQRAPEVAEAPASTASLTPQVAAAAVTTTEEKPAKDYGYRSGEQWVIETEVVEDENAENPAKAKSPDLTHVENGKPAAEETKPAAEEKPAEAKPTAVSQQPLANTDWKEAIKKADKWEVLKELGFDEFSTGMLRYREKAGDVTPYLEAKTVDYKKMTPEQLLKADMQRQHPTMSERTLNFKFNKDFAEKYFLDRDVYPEGSDEAEVGKELLQLDAETLRKKLIEEQEQFKAPEPKPDVNAAQKEQAQKQRQETQKGLIVNNSATKTLQSTSAISFGEGDERFTFPVADPQGIIDNALQTVTASELTNFTETELQNFYKLLAIGKDVNAFEKALAEHYKKIGKKAVQNELGNVTPIVNGTSAKDENLTPAQQLARNGRLT